MTCPHCGKIIPADLIRSEGARAMVASRADRKNPKDKHAAARAKVRELVEKVQELENIYGPSPKK